MNKLLLLLVFALVGLGLFPAVCLAQDAEAVSGSERPDGSELGEDLGPAPELPTGHVQRFVSGYMSSITSNVPRTATVISITNQSNYTCATSVDWKYGLSGNAATTVLVLGPRATGEHCSRPLPQNVCSCNATATPNLTFHEGNATIGSVNVPSACANIAVDARVYYFGSSDTAVAAIADVKVVKYNLKNTGD